MNCFVDANVLVYAVDIAEPAKHEAANALLNRLIDTRELTLSPQCLNETYRVVTAKRSLMTRPDARNYVGMLAAFCRAPLNADTTRLAWSIQDQTGFSWWDTVLLASAIQANCEMFFSEDMAAGAMIGSLRIENPFAPNTEH